VGRGTFCFSSAIAVPPLGGTGVLVHEGARLWYELVGRRPTGTPQLGVTFVGKHKLKLRVKRLGPGNANPLSMGQAPGCNLQWNPVGSIPSCGVGRCNLELGWHAACKDLRSPVGGTNWEQKVSECDTSQRPGRCGGPQHRTRPRCLAGVFPGKSARGGAKAPLFTSLQCDALGQSRSDGRTDRAIGMMFAGHARSVPGFVICLLSDKFFF